MQTSIQYLSPEIFLGIASSSRQKFKRSLLVSDEERANNIVTNICRAFKLDKSFVISHSMRWPLPMARFIIINAIHTEIPLLTLSKIGSIMDGRDHTTIIYALQTYDNLVRYDSKFRKMVKTYQDYLSLRN